LHIKNAFYSPKSNRNLLCFKYIRLNGYHIETNNEGDIEYLYITRIESMRLREIISLLLWLVLHIY